MSDGQAKPVCSVCDLPADKPWSNRALLGTDDLLCEHCFRCWYGNGITDRGELAAASKERRAALAEALERAADRPASLGWHDEERAARSLLSQSKPNE